MRSLKFWSCLAGFVVCLGAQAQHKPYAGQEARDIKALAPDEVQQYLSGAGMGFAIATVGRNTAAALGAGFGYIISLENILGNSIASWRR